MRLSPKCVFCFLNTDIQIGTLFWGKYQVLSCPTQIKNLKISNEAELEKNCFHPCSVSQGQGRARKKGRVQKSVVETYDSMTDRPRGSVAPPWVQVDPAMGTSHLMLYGGSLQKKGQPSLRRGRRLKLAQDPAKTKRQQMNHFLLPEESTLQLCFAGHCSWGWGRGGGRPEQFSEH